MYAKIKHCIKWWRELRHFNDFSKKSKKYSEQSVNKQWDNIKKDGNKTIKSLFFVAQKYGYTEIDDKLEQLEGVQMKDIVIYFNNKKYPNLKLALDDVKNKCHKTISLFFDGATKYISIKKNYSHENDTKTFELSKFKTFQENYSTCLIKYYVSNDNGKQKLINITLPSAIDQISDLFYNGFYFKPYHAFENDKVPSNNGYLNVFSPMIAQRMTEYDSSKKVN